jgi:cytochrome bd-type quinol oxidase subunit 2
MDQTQKIKISLNTAYISGIFTALVALLLLINWLQIKTNDPLETKVMEQLVERIKDEPDNEDLKQRSES